MMTVFTAMNYLLIPTLLLGFGLFALGIWSARRLRNQALFLAFVCCAAVFALPGVVFAAYYLKVFGEPIWLYKFRALPFSELTASGTGFIAGLLHGRLLTNPQFRRRVGAKFFPAILAIGLLLPYLKPILRPPEWNQFRDVWSDGVCLQSSESSCGPACAATLLRRFGKPATEKQIAAESFTSRSGTENWYLARALRRRGVAVHFILIADRAAAWPYPAIAGVRLPGSQNAGHFIVVLDRMGDDYVIGDPLEGRIVQSRSALSESYTFTGLFMVAK